MTHVLSGFSFFSGGFMEDNRLTENKEDNGYRSILCAVYGQGEEEDAAASLDELESLLNTAGGEAVSRVTQMRDKPDGKTVLGKGKIEELAALCESEKANMVIFDSELTPSQIRDIEDELGGDVQVIDRSMLILDIFALHATTAEGRLQVELAQLNYTSPRLVGKGKSMSRLGGSASGSIGSRGPGETKLEIDRRRTRARIAALEEKIEKLSAARATQRAARDRSGLCRVGIVGYTNAGKSTLLNYLTSADILAENKLFATLDTTTRRYTFREGTEILLTDTVGFINKLPHHLVKAFKSTLDEAAYSDILLIVSDISDPECEKKLHVTLDTLDELGAGLKPKLFVFNKVDAADPEMLSSLSSFATSGYECCFISASSGKGVDLMTEKLLSLVNKGKRRVTCLFPLSEGALVNLLYSEADSVESEYGPEGVTCVATVDDRVYGKIKNYVIEE